MQENNTTIDKAAAKAAQETNPKAKKTKAPKEPKKPKAPKAPKGPKQPKAPKASKQPKEPRQSKSAKAAGRAGQRSQKAQNTAGQGGLMLFSIRNKIIVCFLVPILFMVVIGVSAYRMSARGMSDKFLDSSMQTIQMATEYVDMSCTFIASEAMKYAFNEELTQYLANSGDAASLSGSIRSDMLGSQISNPFIANIHVIPKAGINVITTKSAERFDGFFDEYKALVANGPISVTPWVDSHEMVDTHLEVISQDEKYILAYEMLTQSNNAIVIIDIKQSAIEEFLAGLDFGDGSIVGFVTGSGREIICEELAEGEQSSLPEGETVFYDQDFFQEAVASGELQGHREIRYNGEDYLFLYSVSETNGAAVCALVPTRVVTGQAQDIRNLTVTLVLLASLTVLAVGMLIVIGIQNNMKRISRKFGEVAKGDLTVQVTAKGRDEFRGLAGSATNMITNTKKLVDKVNVATDQLEMSSREVEQVSGVIHTYSQDITQAIEEINEGINRQARHAQECVDKTDVLSNEIQNVSAIVERVEKLVQETEVMINQGMEIVRLLGVRAKETTQMTAKVGESIESLRQESEVINSFVGTITDISEQTNLLSLNASIEAARAGEAGRGFAVVAEEIRKLADDSAQAAGEIRNNVEHITAQTMNSVQSANQAGDMVTLQYQAVEQVVDVFQQMRQRMSDLVDGLREIVTGTERADQERSAAMAAVKNISDIIEETATSAETVNEVASKLLENVENLNQTAEALGENMDGLKSEISVFKI